MGFNIKNLTGLPPRLAPGGLSRGPAHAPPTPPGGATGHPHLAARTASAGAAAPRTARLPADPSHGLSAAPKLPPLGRPVDLPDLNTWQPAARPAAPNRAPVQRSASAPVLSSSEQVQAQLMSRQRRIGDVLNMASPSDHGMVDAVFGEKFQHAAGWHGQFQHLGHSASSSLANAGQWDVKSFQALFVAAWATQPTEKGTYMIDLSGLNAEQLSAIKAAHKQHCDSRPSSHLSGKGGSAARNWNFLKGYKELLVQVETIHGKPYLMLKSEGHTTKPRDIVPHMMGWLHKVRTGEGEMASQALHSIATDASSRVEARAAENYSNDYARLLGALDLKSGGKMVTTRQMAERLFDATGFSPKPGQGNAAFLAQATNAEAGQALQAYCRLARQPQAARLRDLGSRGHVDDAMLHELDQVARSLKADGNTVHGRVFREVILSPAALDHTMKTFQGASPGTTPMHGMAPAARPQTAPAATRPSVSPLGAGASLKKAGALLGTFGARAKAGLQSASSVVASGPATRPNRVMVLEGFYGGQPASLKLSQADVRKYARTAGAQATLRGYLEHKIATASATVPSELKVEVNGQAQQPTTMQAGQFMFTSAADAGRRFQSLLKP